MDSKQECKFLNWILSLVFIVFFFSAKAQQNIQIQSSFSAKLLTENIHCDSICSFKSTIHKPLVGQFILPLSLFGAGFIVSGDNDVLDKYEFREERNERLNGFHTKVDDYLQFAPLAAGYGMLASGSKGNAWHYTRQIALTEFILGVSVTGIKTWTKVLRPDGGSKNSFPSGHTAQAFASATLFADYFAQDNPWLKAAAYLTATSVGVLRVMNNRHWVPDVIAGAGVGILSAKLSAFVFEKKCDKQHSKRKTILVGF
ncbi:MAG: phosphatase PAP2 family protein [Bacteroidetes bacterium]|nr:phosphatase PAP2 family protein [Bacteroidota bacterium]